VTHGHRKALSKQNATAWEKSEGVLLRGEMFLAPDLTRLRTRRYNRRRYVDMFSFRHSV
jgi:hypothetical protein